MPACVVQLSTSGEFTFANQQVGDVLVLDPDDLIGRNYDNMELDVWAPDGSPMPDDELLFQQICETGEPAYSDQFIIKEPEEPRKILSVGGAPLLDDDGNIENAIFAFADVTERVVREKRLNTMLENTTVPLFMKHKDGEYLPANRGWKEMFGLEDTEAHGQTDADLFPEGAPTEVQANDRYVLETGKPIEEEEQLVISGEERTFLTSKTPVYDIGTESDPEDPVAMFGAANDITEQKRREERLQRQNSRFDELASAMSHDLRTPIETARGRAELAIETSDTEHMEKYLDTLERANELLEDMVRVLRSREIIDEVGTVDIEQVGQSAWNSITAGNRESTKIQEKFEVKADAGALQRLFENILSNAIEHGSQDVTVEVGKIDTGFYIADTGSGISEKERKKVFTPGYSTKEGGSGVGLASVRQISMAHG